LDSAVFIAVDRANERDWLLVVSADQFLYPFLEAGRWAVGETPGMLTKQARAVKTVRCLRAVAAVITIERMIAPRRQG
jgi:hypothetical protein